MQGVSYILWIRDLTTWTHTVQEEEQAAIGEEGSELPHEMEHGIASGRLSQRGIANVTTVMPRVPNAILDTGNIPNEDSTIDLSVAENWLIRNEILQIEKGIVNNEKLMQR